MAPLDNPGLDPDNHVPMYLQVAAVLRDRVETGEWPEHYRLQSEPDLARRLGVSRGTLRKSLDLLTGEGLLRRVHGRGTYVMSRRFEAPFASELSTISDELGRGGSTFTTAVLAQDLQPASAPIAALLDLRAGETILRLERLRSDDKGPIAYLVNYLRIDGLAGLESVDFTSRSLFAFLEVDCQLDIEYGRRTFTAIAATDLIGSRLNVAVHSPILYLEQITYLVGGRPIEYSDVWVNPERMQIGAVVHRRPRAAAAGKPPRLRPAELNGLGEVDVS